MKLIFTSLFLMISLSSFSQLKVVDMPEEENIGKVKNMFGTFFESYRQGEFFTIMYKDMNYDQIVEYKSFHMNEKSFNELYELIMNKWENPPSDSIMIELKESFIWLDFKRALGITNLIIRHAPSKNANIYGRSAALTEKKVKKLFGKK